MSAPEQYEDEFILTEEQRAYSENALWLRGQTEDAVTYLCCASSEQPESQETLVFGKGCKETVPSVLVVQLYKDCTNGDALWPEVRIPQEAIHEDSEVYKEGDSGMLVLKREWAIAHNWYTDTEEDWEEDE